MNVREGEGVGRSALDRLEGTFVFIKVTDQKRWRVCVSVRLRGVHGVDGSLHKQTKKKAKEMRCSSISAGCRAEEALKFFAFVALVP